MNLIKIRNSFLYLSVIGFFFFPFYQTHLISIAFFLTFFTGEFKNFSTLLKKNKIALLFIVFFSIHLVSMLYTENISSGWHGIEVKLAFIAFPLFLPLIFNSKTVNFYLIFKIMIYTGIGYCLLSFGRAGLIFLESKNVSDLLSSNLGFRIGQSHPFVHPTYVSLYLNVLSLLLIYKLIKINTTNKYKLFTFGTTALFFIFIVFSSSKLGILLMLINVIILLTYYAIKKSKIKKSLIILSVFSLITVTGIYNSPLKIRFEQAYKEIFHGNKNASGYQMSTGTRIWTWKSTTYIIQDNLLQGVGIGDIREELKIKYKELGITDESRNKLDSHQQFLQTFATIGVFGFINLIMIFFILFQKAIKTKNILLFSFALFYFIFGLTESMLETQAGIVFFTFIAILFYQIPAKNFIESQLFKRN